MRTASRRKNRAGWTDPVTGAVRATPWITRTDNAMYTGLNGEVWLYTLLPNRSLRHADAGELIDWASRLEALLADIGSSSIRQPPGGLITAGLYREMHILAVNQTGQVQVPDATEPGLVGYLDGLCRFPAPAMHVYVGIRLRDMDATRASRSGGGFGAFILDSLDGLFTTRVTDHRRYEPDLRFLQPILARAGCTTPTFQQRQHLETWWNPDGAHTEPEVQAFPDRLIVGGNRELRFSALADFREPVMAGPWRQWAAEVFDHPDGPTAVSVRFELQPASDTRKTLRKTLIKQTIEADEAAKELGPARQEESEKAQLAAFAEAQVSGTGAPATLRNVSIVFGQSSRKDVVETYEDYLRGNYAIDVKPLVHRQMAALEEVQPGGARRASPFPQHLMPSMVAYAGLGIATAVGDDAGALLGRGVPDGCPVWFDPTASSRANTPPGFGIFGVPGSGKTLAAMHLTYQSALAGHHTIFVNPQVAHSMVAVAEFMQDQGIDVEHVSLTRLLSDPDGAGLYDPFRYAATRETAAALAATYLTTIVDMDQRQRTALRSGLHRGSRAGARSVGQALDMVDDSDVVALIRSMAESTPLVALVVGEQPKSRLVLDPGQAEPAAAGGRFTLVELDMDLGLPSQVKTAYTDAERIGIATVQAITAASVGILAGRHGGLLMVDEAHNLLHGETIRSLDKLLREGRKLNVCLGLISQQARDLLDAGMETYISRVLALRMTDRADAAAALKLVGYESSPERIEQMRTFGAQRRADGTFDPALGYFRDVHDRKALVSVGPIGSEFLQAASTNIDDEEARRRAAESGMEAAL